MVLHKLHESVDSSLAKHGIWVEHQKVLARKTPEHEVVVGRKGIATLLFDYFDPRILIANKLRRAIRGAVIDQDYLERIELRAARYGIQALRDKPSIVGANNPDQGLDDFSLRHFCSFVPSYSTSRFYSTVVTVPTHATIPDGFARW